MNKKTKLVTRILCAILAVAMVGSIAFTMLYQLILGV